MLLRTNIASGFVSTAHLLHICDVLGAEPVHLNHWAKAEHVCKAFHVTRDDLFKLANVHILHIVVFAENTDDPQILIHPDKFLEWGSSEIVTTIRRQ